MTLGRRLTVVLAAAALSTTSTLALATSAGAAPDGADDVRTPDAAVSVDGVAPVVAPVLDAPATTDARSKVASAQRPRRPLFAFWGQKYNRIDGFGFSTATRGSGTGIELTAAWKTYRGATPIKPKKVFVQARVDGGKWSRMKGVRATIGKRGLVKASIPAFVNTPGVAAQTVDYRLKTKKIKKGPRKARRSVASKPVSVRFENQAMYTGDQARFYAPIANLCPNAAITIDTTGEITGAKDAVFSWQHGITMDVASLAAPTGETEASKLAIAIHECAHMKQFYNWGGTAQGWKTLEARSAEIFVPDQNPSGPVIPLASDWAPLEHAADCATFLVTGGAQRTYGSWCNPTESAAAALLWQNLRY
ncbi:hypothetical protein [Nocardioides hwasunensis]|uniref:Lysine-specific metallo-endopeptidase domain-containing protein n=1 Tax=Nocardioides hwasunensis TaxID=397258 RepID=A0ABR8MP14_9ACTN|nr:hypothetical protein [Nocardioides hwasunensis]MBD3916545.1 hypothetical protein [Nocardioides hwasunensis]